MYYKKLQKRAKINKKILVSHEVISQAQPIYTKTEECLFDRVNLRNYPSDYYGTIIEK